ITGENAGKSHVRRDSHETITPSLVWLPKVGKLPGGYGGDHSKARRSMKAVILAGGRGTRISEESSARPKPMIEIGTKPVLWHIMKIYSAAGIRDFVICLGYRGYMIKEYFANYFLHSCDVTFDIEKNSMQVHAQAAEPWRVTL